MVSLRRSLGFALFVIATPGCATEAEDTAASDADLSTALHEPHGDERKAILGAFREVLSSDLQGQEVVFNSTDPPGRFQAHADWASYEGILEGPNGNATPIDYTKGVYNTLSERKLLAGVQRNGHFAATFFGMAHRGTDGAWHVVTLTKSSKSYAVGPSYDAWSAWAGLPPLAKRDVSRAFPKDDLHEPQGDERAAILRGLHAVVDPELGAQSCVFNSTDPKGTFLEHDGWVYYRGLIEGPNGNATPIDYRNTSYRAQAGQPSFEGILRNGHFAAAVSALMQRQPDGSWKPSAQTFGSIHAKGYSVGAYSYFGEPSRFAADIYPPDGDGE